jgi:hypothetical protein
MTSFTLTLILRGRLASSDKVVELVKRGGRLADQERRLMLNQTIATGRGGVLH